MTREINGVEKIIGFDLDGVIVDHTEAKKRLAANKGFFLKDEETASDAIKKLIPSEPLREIQQDLYGNCNNQPLVEGALDTLIKIKNSGAKYFLVSRRHHGEARKRALEILQNRGLWPDIFNKDNVFFVDSAEGKNTVSEKLGITDYVDDEANVLEKLSFVKNRILFACFKTKKETPYKKVSSWQELYDLIF
jgi:5'(3')-deoxyribonucleotidase